VQQPEVRGRVTGRAQHGFIEERRPSAVRSGDLLVPEVDNWGKGARGLFEVASADDLASAAGSSKLKGNARTFAPKGFFRTHEFVSATTSRPSSRSRAAIHFPEYPKASVRA
jgi:hypothetical protein